MSRANLFSLISLIVIAAAIIWGVQSISSPQRMRDVRLDQNRLNDLGAIVRAINSYVGVNEVVPGSLDDLDPSVKVGLKLTDRVSGEAYEYEAAGAQSFKVCATFLTDEARTPGMFGYGYTDFLISEQDWQHDSGHQCFEFKAQKRD